MSTLSPAIEMVMAKPRKASAPETAPARDRFDIRADPAWMERVEKQARRFGLQFSAYVRQAVTERLERDEASEQSRKQR